MTSKTALTGASDRFAFSGLMLVGKDFVAGRAELPIVGFADPIYELCDHFLGTRDKNVPGVRRFMQLIGQWGWGNIDEEYPHSVERAQFVHLMRTQGHAFTRQYVWVDWTEYGKRKDFWVNILLMKLGLRALPGLKQITSQAELFAEFQNKDARYAIVNARFDHEFEPIMGAGFRHFHVMCSDETRRERMLAKGYVITDKENLDKSEQLAWKLNQQALAGVFPAANVIWNDHRPTPNGLNFLKLDDFLKTNLLGDFRSVVTALADSDKQRQAVAA